MGLLTGTARRLLQNLFARTKTGAVSFSSRIVKGFAKAAGTGVLSFAGRIANKGFAKAARVGVLSFAGRVANKGFAKAARVGVVSFAGSALSLGQNLFARTMSGVASFSGAYSYVVESAQNLYTYTASGLQTLSGSILRTIDVIRNYAGSATFAGSVLRLSQNLFARTKAGTISLSGILARIFESFKSINSSLTFAGTVISKSKYDLWVTVSGILSFAGGLVRRVPLSGQIYRTIDIARGTAGYLVLSGIATYATGLQNVKDYFGILTLSGSLLYSISRLRASSGIQSLTGKVSKLLNWVRTRTGSIAPSGIVRRSNVILTKTYTGALDFSGVVYRGLYSTYTGALTFAGTATSSAKECVYTASGGIAIAGTFLRELVLDRLRSGSISINGIVSGIKSSGAQYYWISVAGSLIPSGIIGASKNVTYKLVTGVLLPIGRLTQLDIIQDRISSATLSVTGSLLRRVTTARSKLASSLVLSGLISISGRFKRSTMAGVISFAGAVSNSTTGGVWNYTAYGIETISGAIYRLLDLLRTKAGSLSISGSITKLIEIAKQKDGVLSFAGNVLSSITGGDWRTGSLSFASSLTPYLVTYRNTYASNLTCTGIVTRALQSARVIVSGQISLSGFNEGYKDIFYFGPSNP